MTTLIRRLRPVLTTGQQKAMGALIRRGRIPRLGFQHYFIEDEGLRSRIHLQNFWSTFFPDVATTVTGRIQVFSSSGRALGDRAFTLAPFGSLFLEMHDVLAELGAAECEGSLTIDLEPPQAVIDQVAAFPLDEPWSLRFQTPFWMAYYDDAENYMYVHSIDRFSGAFYGVPAPVDWFLRRKYGRTGEPWRAGRLLDLDGISELQLVVVNHGTQAHKTTLGLYAPTDEAIWQKGIEVAPGALKRVHIELDAVRVDGADRSEPLLARLGADPLLTANGKPYVLMRYGDGPLSLHHG